MFRITTGFLFFYFKMSKCVPQCTQNLLHSSQSHCPCEWQYPQIQTEEEKANFKHGEYFESILETVEESWVVRSIMIAGLKRWGKQLNNISTRSFNVCQSTNKCCSPGGLLPAVAHVKWDALTFSVSVLIADTFHIIG